jgi:hypothetical protein
MRASSNVFAAEAGEEVAQMQPTATREELEAKAARVDERKLVRKLDLYIIPLVMALYLFSFIDR